MSAFLGPIHYFMFQKIKFQDDFCLHLLKKADEKHPGFLKETENETGRLPEGELSEIVDPSNIHGSLQTMIGEVEHKLAYSVHKILSNGLYTQKELVRFANEYGRSLSDNLPLTPEEAYKRLFETLLNGMPCDRIWEIPEKRENYILWNETEDIHSVFWKEFERDGSLFYLLRTALVEGLLHSSGVIFETMSPFHYRLRRES